MRGVEDGVMFEYGDVAGVGIGYDGCYEVGVVVAAGQSSYQLGSGKGGVGEQEDDEGGVEIESCHA